MKKFLLIPLLFLSTPALSATKSDAMKWEAGYQVLNAVDLGATLYCLHRVSDCEEANPIFGKHPKTWQLIASKVAFGGLHFILVDRLANKNPKTAMRVAQISVVLQGAIVGLNARVIF